MADGYPDDRLDRILVAVETIETSIEILTAYQDHSRAEYRDDRQARDVVERRFVKATEAAIDIGETILKEETGEPPATRQETFERLHDHGVIDEETTDDMVEAAGFRDVLAHTYGDVIDDDLVYDALQEGLDRYLAFLTAVRDHLDAQGVLE